MNTLTAKRETPRIRAQRRFGKQARTTEERRVLNAARRKHSAAWLVLERSVESLLSQHDLGRFDLETKQVTVAASSRRIINLDLVPLSNLYPGGNRYQLYLSPQDCQLYLADHDQPAVRVRKRDHGTLQLAKMAEAVVFAHDELLFAGLDEEG